MDTSELLALFSAVAGLAVGVAYLYLWSAVLPRRYVTLFAAERLLAIPQAALLVLELHHPAFGTQAALAAFFGTGTACFVGGCYDLIRRRLHVLPLVLLAAAMFALGAAGPPVTSNLVAPVASAVLRGSVLLWLGWLFLRGQRLSAHRPLALLLAIGGLHAFDYPLLVTRTWGLIFGAALFQFISIAISVFLLITLLDEARGLAEDTAAKQREAEAALRKSEEKFAKAFRSSPNPIVIARLDDGLVVDVNDAFSAATGYARADVVGRSTREVLWPDPERRQDLVRELRTHGRVRDMELKMLTKTGPPLDVLVSIETIELDGKPHTLGAAVDVSTQKLALEALRESEERFRRLVQDLSVGVAVVDGEGRVLLSNRAAREIFGVTERQVSEPGFWQRELVAIHEDGSPYREEERPVLNAVRTGQPVRNAVLGFQLPSKPDRVWAIVNADPQLDSEGRVRNIIITVHDITDRRRTDEEQRRLREAVMASAVDWTLTFDAVQSPVIILGADGRVRRLNAEARALAGKATYGDAVGRTLPELGTLEPWRGLAELAAEVRRRRAPASSQVREGPHRRSWYLTASVVTVPGEEDRLILVARDVSDLVRLEESLRRTETMSALGSLVAGVAHEVRNPLFAISATVDAFEARFGKEEKSDRYLGTLRHEVDRLSQLMADLLDYGKPPKLELVEGAVPPVIARAIAASAALAKRREVSVVTELPPDLPGIPLDSGRMQQVFQNLVDNALQHSPKGGVVTIRGREVTGETRVGLEITVSDQGPGFRLEDLGRIFDPFFTRRRGGTGLGLSIVQRIVEQHGGAVSAANGPEGGAVVTVRLIPDGPTPAVREAARAEA